MNGPRSCLYTGAVIHQRLAPKAHKLRYRMVQALFDLDEIADLDRSLRLFSHNSFNMMSFHDRDHGDGQSTPLRGYVERTLSAAGIEVCDGRILLLCMPRIWGYAFNPLSIYYCYGQNGLVAMLYEVNNTFGQRHSYLINANAKSQGGVDQSCDKAFHVSPFLDMAMRYQFRVSSPGEAINTTIHGRGLGGALILTASFVGRRRVLDDASVLARVVRDPMATLKVLPAIHLEALKLWVKGVRLRPVAPPPAQAVTFVSAPSR